MWKRTTPRCKCEEVRIFWGHLGGCLLQLDSPIAKQSSQLPVVESEDKFWAWSYFSIRKLTGGTKSGQTLVFMRFAFLSLLSLPSASLHCHLPWSSTLLFLTLTFSLNFRCIFPAHSTCSGLHRLLKYMMLFQTSGPLYMLVLFWEYCPWSVIFIQSLADSCSSCSSLRPQLKCYFLEQCLLTPPVADWFPHSTCLPYNVILSSLCEVVSLCYLI